MKRKIRKNDNFLSSTAPRVFSLIQIIIYTYDMNHRANHARAHASASFFFFDVLTNTQAAVEHVQTHTHARIRRDVLAAAAARLSLEGG